ncbi:TPA: hypothetical protein DEP94_02865 [Candidatus Nomurabacteria bacterium]|nr:hypothetical protein [Candidatus Nomurabacteria bacterium]
MKILSLLKKYYSRIISPLKEFFFKDKKGSMPIIGDNFNFQTNSESIPSSNDVSLALIDISVKQKEVIQILQEVKDIKEEAKDLLKDVKYKVGVQEKKIESMSSLVFLGFFVLILMVVGLLMSYIQFIYSNNLESVSKYDILDEKITNQNIEMILLKKCLKTGAYGICFN